MNSMQVNCFLAAAKYLNFTTAAASLHVTQSTLSKNISAMEQELELQLFFRNYKSVCLTPGGELMARELGAARAEFRQTAASARLANLNFTGQLTLGWLTGQLISEKQGRLLHSFEEAHPNIHVSLSEGSFGQLLARLRSGELDMALTTTFSLAFESGLDYQELETVENYLILHHGNPLAKREKLCLADLRDQTFLSVSSDDSAVVTNNYRRTCREAGFEPRMLEAPDMAAMVLWLEMNRGITVLNQQHTASGYPQFVRRRIPEFAPVTVSFAWPSGNTNPALLLFLSHLDRFREAGKTE